MAGRSLNLVHRDLNPQNVLISYGGDVKNHRLRHRQDPELSTVKTEAGVIKGKFVYMSPEQSLAKKLDKRSDIFAIGISLYEMLTGIDPFQKNNIVLTLEAVQRFEPPPPSEYDPSYALFDPIISKALAKDRDRRYSDAAEMQDDLRRVVLPRPAERLGQFMCRVFRVQMEEEQKLLHDSDRARNPGRHPPQDSVPAGGDAAARTEQRPHRDDARISRAATERSCCPALPTPRRRLALRSNLRRRHCGPTAPATPWSTRTAVRLRWRTICRARPRCSSRARRCRHRRRASPPLAGSSPSRKRSRRSRPAHRVPRSRAAASRGPKALPRRASRRPRTS